MSDNSGFAYPLPPFENRNGDVQWGANGMTLLQHYAGQALIGIIADPNNISSVEDNAKFCFLQAEAMVAEYNRRYQ